MPSVAEWFVGYILDGQRDGLRTPREDRFKSGAGQPLWKAQRGVDRKLPTEAHGV